MWQLKSLVIGEAASPISHLSNTSENYETAWKILGDQNNNKRMLVFTMITGIVS